MKLWIRLALRNVTRNVRRTMLTVLTIVVGTGLVTLALAWMGGVFGGIISEYTAVSGHIRVVDADFAARESLQPLYENIADVEPVLQAVRSVPGVVTAEPRITTGVVLSAGEEIGDDFGLVVGATESYYQNQFKASTKLIAGKWLSGAEKEVVLGRKLANQLKVSVGAEVLILGQTQNGSMSPVGAKVVGMVGGDAMSDMQAYMTLEEVRWLTDMTGGALEILVWTSSREPAVIGPVVAALKEKLGPQGLALEPWNARQPWATMMPMMDGMRGFIQFLIVFVAALAIFNTMTMSVLERTTEIGVMRAMGLTRPGAVGLFVLEGLVIGLVGGVFGTLLGALPSWYFETRGVTLGEDMVEKVGNMPLRATMYADLTSDIVIQSVMIGLTIAVVGAVLPAIRASRIAPVTAMSARR